MARGPSRFAKPAARNARFAPERRNFQRVSGRESVTQIQRKLDAQRRRQAKVYAPKSRWNRTTGAPTRRPTRKGY